MCFCVSLLLVCFESYPFSTQQSPQSGEAGTRYFAVSVLMRAIQWSFEEYKNLNSCGSCWPLSDTYDDLVGRLQGMCFCFRFVSIYRSLSFIYMWTVMVMTLHTLQFNPIINILTQRKVTTKIIFFFGRELLVLLCLALVGPHDHSECSEKKI